MLNSTNIRGPSMAEQERKPKWEVAYHFSSNRNIAISEILQMRRGRDPRAGDLWCHKACYPNTGTRLSSRDCSNSGRTSHFAKWKGENQFQSSCSYISFSNSRRESINYAQYYHDLKFYFSELEKNQPPFWIGNIEFGNDVSEPDLTITHSPNSGLEWLKTHIVIIDTNTKRKMKFTRNGNFRIESEYYLVVVISELTPEQLADFQRNGVERIMLSWEKLQKEYAETQIQIANQPIIKSQRQLEIEAEERKRERLRKQNKVLQHPDAQKYVKVVKDRIKELEQKILPLKSEIKDLGNCEFYTDRNYSGTRKRCRHLEKVDFELRRITEYTLLHNDLLAQSETKLRRSKIPSQIVSIKTSMYSEVRKAAKEMGFDLNSLMEDENLL